VCLQEIRTPDVNVSVLRRRYKDCDMLDLLQPANWQGESEVLHVVPGDNPPPTTVFALPYIRHDSGAQGVLLVNKHQSPTVVMLVAGSFPGNSTTALVVDGTVDGVTVDLEPGFVPPVERTIGSDGGLLLGPYAVAVVQAGKVA
jgi:hypothetical protein